MSGEAPAGPGTLRTLRLLLGTARRRAKARRLRQRTLVRQRSPLGGGSSGVFGLLPILLAFAANLIAALLITGLVTDGERLDAERHGRIVVGSAFATQAMSLTRVAGDPAAAARLMRPDIAREADALARSAGSDRDATARRLTAMVRQGHAADLVGADRATPGLTALGLRGLPAMLGSLALAGWLLMLIVQGEGPEYDAGRRRHPMWEWLFSHPVPPRAVFLAEMLSPIAANPVYWAAPLVPSVLYGTIYGIPQGLAAAILVGVPVPVAAACLGKGIEIAAMLRLRTALRGTVLGLLGWLGTISVSLIFACNVARDQIAAGADRAFGTAAAYPWPWLGLFLGLRPDGAFSFGRGVLCCALASAAIMVAAIALAVLASGRGLSAPAAPADLRPTATRSRAPSGRHPLLRKEALWFRRDRSALVQVFLVPMTMAGLQFFYFHGLFAAAREQWTGLCAAGILLGTFFLDAIGPKSLRSEGGALWIALSWPHSLETLLKEKARLWTIVSSVIVGLILFYALWCFPGAWAGIGLVSIGWVLFARSQAVRTVTLARPTDSAGEAEPVPAGQRWAVHLGIMPFFVGVLTRQWPLAVAGIVYAEATSAAMWQNFRARLPYLLDPWSERVPTPPTLMHAMIAVSALVEGSAVLLGLSTLMFSHAQAAAGEAIVYGLTALIVSLSVARFLLKRDVGQSDIWLWRTASAPKPLFLSLLSGLAVGAALGTLGCAYVAALGHIGWITDAARQADTVLNTIPHMREWLFVMTVLVAPPTEEFLFRGLLYRALDREWRDWRAVAGSAVFFASYHPLRSWLPVGLLGAGNALLFRRTGRLAAPVVAHATYNAIVMSWTFGWL